MLLATGCTASPASVDSVGPPTPLSAVVAGSAYGAPQELFAFQDSEIVESSGVVTSFQDDRIVFTHNDSGDTPRFFAVDDHGCTIARYAVRGAKSSDWEDIAHSKDSAGRGVLWLGDIGDNAASRDHLSIYRTPEPRALPGSSDRCAPAKELSTPGQGFDLVYPDGPHDAEALLADPLTSQLYIVTKATEPDSVPALYAAPVKLIAGTRNRLRKVTDVQIPDRTSMPTVNPLAAFPLGIVPGKHLVTGADFAPDRSRVIVRTYSDAYEWSISGGDITQAMRGPATTHVVLPGEPQGEAIGYTRDSRGFIITSEDTVKSKPPVYLIRRGS